MQQPWRLVVWLAAVEASMTVFGVTTAPLLLAFVADIAVGWLIIRSIIEMRAAAVAQPAGGPTPPSLFLGVGAAARHGRDKGGQ